MTETPARSDTTLEALVAGVVDEFQARRRRGERPDIEEYAGRHPEAADLLRRVLAALQLFAEAEQNAFTMWLP